MSASYTLADELAYLALPEDVRAITDRYVGYRLSGATVEIETANERRLAEIIDEEVERAVTSAVWGIGDDVAKRLKRAAAANVARSA